MAERVEQADGEEESQSRDPPPPSLCLELVPDEGVLAPFRAT